MICYYYAIKHKPTGFFMPQADKSRGKGYTHHVPLDPLKHAPRLFVKKRAANDALRWWLLGHTSVLRFEDGDETWSTDPDADRKAEDMEVVELQVEVD